MLAFTLSADAELHLVLLLITGNVCLPALALPLILCRVTRRWGVRVALLSLVINALTALVYGTRDFLHLGRIRDAWFLILMPAIPALLYGIGRKLPRPRKRRRDFHRPISLEEFWALLDASKQAAPDDLEQQSRVLCAELMKRPSWHSSSFHFHAHDMAGMAFTWKMLLAATLIARRSGREMIFGHFALWLVTLGSEDFDRVLQDPDHLADLVYEPPFSYDFLEGVRHVYLTKVRREHLPLPGQWEPGFIAPQGEPLALTTESMQQHLPRLWARYGDPEDKWNPPAGPGPDSASPTG